MKSIDFGRLNFAEVRRGRSRGARRLERGARLDARGGLDDRLDLLAPVLVRDAEHGDVADLRVRQEHAFDLGRIDVDAARDDHVDLAVAQEQVAVLVEVADVADGEEPVRAGSRSVFSASSLYSKLPVASDMYTVPISPGGSSLPSSSRIADLRARPRLADRAGLLEPLLGGDDRAAALGRRVVLA